MIFNYTDSSTGTATWFGATTGSANSIWVAWSSASSSTDSVWQSWTGATYAPAESAAARREKEREREEAQERSEKLLRICLTPEQRRQLDEQASFLVESERKRPYRIKKGWVRNVERLDENGKAVARYCIQSRKSIPIYDAMLAQKLMLEACETDFLRIANRTPL